MFAKIENNAVVAYDLDPCPDGDWRPVTQTCSEYVDPLRHDLETTSEVVLPDGVRRHVRPVTKVASVDLSSRVARLETALSAVAAMAERMQLQETALAQMAECVSAGNIRAIEVERRIAKIEAFVAALDAEARKRLGIAA